MQFSTLLTTIAQTTVIKACCARHSVSIEVLTLRRRRR